MRRWEECYPVDGDDGEQVTGDEPHDDDSHGGEDSGEAAAARKVREPRMPSDRERREHEATHCPYRSWCEHCVRGAGAEYHHSSVRGANAEESVPRVILDYCFFTEEAKRTADEHTEAVEAVTSLTALVMKETMYDSVWAYALKSKSVSEDPWIVDQVVDDLNTIGMANERVIIKSDQESSITEMQSEIAKKRPTVSTGTENSKVGDSNSNGKIERAIRDVGNMVRTLRSFLSRKIGQSVKLDMKIVPWLVRHASYLITRCRVRAHGKTALQMIKGRTSLTELIPFGERILFKIPKTGQAVGSFEDRWEEGIWLGCTVRDGMTLVGTPMGVFKVGTIKRRAEDEQWSYESISQLIGSPQQPQPGVESRRVVTFAKKKMERQEERLSCQPPTSRPQEPRQVKIMKSDVERFGPTDGCAACRAIASGKPWRAAHSFDCRRRMEDLMAGDVEGKRRLDRASERITHHIVDNSEIAEEERKRPRLDSPPKTTAATPAPSPGGDGAQDDQAMQPAEATGTRSMDDPLVQRLKTAARKHTGSEGMDTTGGTAGKRKAEADAEDPRADDGGGAEVVHDTVDDNMGQNSGTASSSKDAVMDSVEVHQCKHCQEEFSSRNDMFRHLYARHDDDGEGHRLRQMMDEKKSEGGERKHYQESQKAATSVSRHGILRYVENGRHHTDETAQPALYHEQAERHQAKSKPSFDMNEAGCSIVRPIMAV